MISTMRRKMKSRGGFTLVELLVVIVILGILAAIGIQQFGAVQTNAANRAHESNVRLLRSAGQMYYMSTESIGDNIDLVGAGFIEEMPRTPRRATNIADDDTDVLYEVNIVDDNGGNVQVTVSPGIATE